MKLLNGTALFFAFVLTFLCLLWVGPQANGQQSGDPAKGKEVFEANCSICHEVTDQDKVGPGLKGISKKGPHKLSDGTEHKDHSPAVIRKQVMEGGGAMPPIGAGLSAKEVDDVVAYLLTL